MSANKYPVRIERDTTGRYLCTCRDVPEALTDGDDRSEAKTKMADALMVALEGYRMAARPLPTASRPEPAEVIALAHSTWRLKPARSNSLVN
ncbi:MULTISPECIES: type II toxin-antitoxin system HicB family antitoxin [unclassified Thioalkalivibrio]|uniref:type II toxin-antitoxin system HicB family antitoxin n=1 Tax=unclassified Thioalkalivibrio TaxID=2621013 RepID=UPI0009D93F67|nr:MULTISPECIES: type II toxin-antitoxin system HicB family antitoxin [unclassified Thioalkalivibrio]